MTVQIREATGADYPAAAQLLRDSSPRNHVTTEMLEASARKVRQHPLRLHLAQWVATENGEVVGFAGVSQWPGSFHPQRYDAQLTVPPAWAGRGIGTQLAAIMQEHLQQRGAREVLTRAYEDEAHAVEFLTHRGFRESSRSFDNVLRLDEVAPMPVPPLPAGLQLVTLHDYLQQR